MSYLVRSQSFNVFIYLLYSQRNLLKKFIFCFNVHYCNLFPTDPKKAFHLPRMNLEMMNNERKSYGLPIQQRF